MKNQKKTYIIILVFILAISIFLSLFMLREPDYFWHIKAGEYMFKHGVLKKDIFSWSVRGKYWMSHEWLFEVILYWFKTIFSSYHLLVYGFVSLLTLFLILLFTNKENYLKNPFFSALWIIGSSIMIPFMQARPHLISFSLLSLVIWFLYDLYKDENSKKIYFLPIISIIWANVHGGSSNLSYLLCLVFIIGGLFNYSNSKIEFRKNTKKQNLKYLGMGIVSALSININIHGFKMFLYPYQNMMNKVMITNISEWFPTNLNDFTHYTYIIFLVIIFMVLLLSKNKISFMDFLLFGICVFLGLKSTRFWAYTYIIMSYVIFNYVNNNSDTDGLILGISSCICIFLLSAILNRNSFIERYNSKCLSDDLIKVIKKENPKRLFNGYDLGGELVYNDIDVFIDGRADLYSKYTFENYLIISRFGTGVLDLIDSYKFDYYLVTEDMALYNYLISNSNFVNVYNKNNVYLFRNVNVNV